MMGMSLRERSEMFEIDQVMVGHKTMGGIQSIGLLLNIAERSCEHNQMVNEGAQMSKISHGSVSIFYTHPPFFYHIIYFSYPSPLKETRGLRTQC